jgi:hypothetical protein
VFPDLVFSMCSILMRVCLCVYVFVFVYVCVRVCVCVCDFEPFVFYSML